VGQNIHRRYFGDNLGVRWQSNFDLPELKLLFERFPKIKNLHAYIGTKPKVYDWMFWLLSWPVRWKIIKSWRYWPKFIENKILFKKYGKGITGTDQNYQPLKIMCSIIADKGEGCYLSAITAALVINKMIAEKYQFGAYPCINLYSTEEFKNRLEGRAIYYLHEVFHD
jgi:hypothetical protein